MSFAEMMDYLRLYWREGTIALCTVVCISYLIFSIRLLFSSRDAKMKIYSLAFIPVVNIIVWVVKCRKVRKLRKMALREEIEI